MLPDLDPSRVEVAEREGRDVCRQEFHCSCAANWSKLLRGRLHGLVHTTGTGATIKQLDHHLRRLVARLRTGSGPGGRPSFCRGLRRSNLSRVARRDDEWAGEDSLMPAALLVPASRYDMLQ